MARSLEIELERLNTDESYFKSLPKLMKSKRDYLAKILVNVNLFLYQVDLKSVLAYSLTGRSGDEIRRSPRRLFHGRRLVSSR